MRADFKRPVRSLARVGLLMILCCVAAPATAQEQAIETGRERLQEFLSSVHSLRADFQQTLFSADGQSQPASTGLFLLKRPGRFLWDYRTPYQQIVLSDGESLWSIDPDLDQAVVKRLGEAMAASPAMLLSGDRDLEDVFSIELVKQEDGLLKVYLAPLQSGGDFQALCLGFDGKSLKRLELVDNLDQVTRIDFSGLEINPELGDDNFTYVPPAGMDVIRQD
jgi:outer membrane lipoprotein carrier protein